MKPYTLTIYDVPMHNKLYKVEVKLTGNSLKVLSCGIKNAKICFFRKNLEVDPEYLPMIKELALKKLELMKGWGIL